jgi:aspartate kinase
MLVMKFGGTSVADATAMRRVINHIKNRRESKTIVVVSAISQATNILTEVAHLSAKNQLKKCETILAPFRRRHLKIATNLLADKKLLTATIKQINNYFSEIIATIKTVSKKTGLSDRNFAQIVAYGELLSSTILHAAMQQHGIKNILIDARSLVITDDNYLKGNPDMAYMTKHVPNLLNKHIKQNTLVLTQGFIAGTRKGITTILGREGSDYSATLIGSVMNANEVQIWTDVDGIMTSDPRTIANTKLIPQLSFEEAADLSYFGAKVIHPATVYPVASKNIPVRILNSTKPDPKQKGTLILNTPKSKQIKISSITYKENIKVLNISPKQTSRAPNFLATIYSLLNTYKISIDMAVSSGTTITLLINQNGDLKKIIHKLAKDAVITTEEDYSLICLVGNNLNPRDGITKNIFKALSRFPFKMIIGGQSSSHLLLLIKRGGLLTTTQRLHDNFFNKNKH